MILFYTYIFFILAIQFNWSLSIKCECFLFVVSLIFNRQLRNVSKMFLICVRNYFSSTKMQPIKKEISLKLTIYESVFRRCDHNSYTDTHTHRHEKKYHRLVMSINLIFMYNIMGFFYISFIVIDVCCRLIKRSGDNSALQLNISNVQRNWLWFLDDFSYSHRFSK